MYIELAILYQAIKKIATCKMCDIHSYIASWLLD